LNFLQTMVSGTTHITPVGTSKINTESSRQPKLHKWKRYSAPLKNRYLKEAKMTDESLTNKVLIGIIVIAIVLVLLFMPDLIN